MSTYVGNHIPQNQEWFKFDTFCSKIKNFTPEMVKKFYDVGIRKIYLSMGYNKATLQHQIQTKFSEEKWKHLVGFKFDVVIIDSLNPPYASIQKLFPARMYLMGTEFNPMFGDPYNSWTPENHTDPFTTEKQSLERKYYDEIYLAPSKTYEHLICHIQNVWNRVLDMPPVPTPEEKKEIQWKKDLESSPFGNQIEIISRYAHQNWICVDAPPNHPIPEDKYEEKYHFRPQAIIRQIPITYSYQGKEYEGGQIVRPLEKGVSRYEYEYFFAFGGNCQYFNSEKTRYYYSSNMSIPKKYAKSIFEFLQDFEESPRDREFLKFLVWVSINYLGVLISHREKKMANELAESLKIEKLTRKELDSLMFPIP